jgi:hypothetical protein
MSDNQFYSVIDEFDKLFAVCPPRSCAHKRYYRAVPDGEIVTPLDNGEPVYHHPLSAIAACAILSLCPASAAGIMIATIR